MRLLNFTGKAPLTDLLMAESTTNSTPYSQEDINFVFDLADTSTEDLLEAVNTLSNEGKRIQKCLALTNIALSRRKPFAPPSGEDVGKANPDQPQVTSVVKRVLPAPTADEGVDENKKRYKDREMNLQKFIETKGWIFRTVVEEEFDDERLNGLRLTKPNDVRELARQLLRRAREKGFVIDRLVYTFSSFNQRVISVLLYGSPKFKNSEHKAEYDLQFSREVKRLGFFETKEEAGKHPPQKASDGQLQLEAH